MQTPSNTTIEEKLKVAVDLHQRSQFEAAQDIYEEVLKLDPDNVDATHLLGVIELQSGNNVSALERLLKASRKLPDAVNILSNLGTAQRRLGKFDDALATYQRAITLDPQHAESFYNLGIALKAMDRPAEAANSIRKAIELRPNYVEAIRTLTQLEIANGNWQEAIHGAQLAAQANPQEFSGHMRLAECHMRMKQFPEAIVAFQAALAIEADHLVALNGLGLAYKAVLKLDEAEKTLARVIELDPQNFPALANLGTVYQGQKNFDKAIEKYREAIKLKPDSAEAHNNLGGALKEQGELEDARVHCEKAIELKPDLASAHCNSAALAQLQGDFDSAIAGYQKALEIQGDLNEGHLGLGSAYAQLGQLKQARACYSRSLFFDPKNAEARLYRGIIGLLDGDLENAWSDYEWRWQTPENSRRKIAAPRWDGSDLKDRSMLLHAEQGLGDTLQFVRYGKQIRERGGKLIVECQKALLPLLSRLDWIDQLVAQGETLPPFMCHVPMLSIPGVLGTNIDNIPGEIPYLTADPDLVEKWRESLSEIEGCKIGIAWQGNPDFKQDKFRSIPLSRFSELLDIEGARFISLQKGFGEEQIQKLERPERLMVLENVDTDEGAFMDTAAILGHLDLFITSDSAIAHLAGALGIPTWLILPYAPDWRWFLKREDTPWYPSMRLFRQTEFNCWDGVFQKLARALQSFLAQSPVEAHA